MFGVQIPVILHEDDFKIAADQELFQLIFLLSLSHMSQDKLNKLKWEKHKNTKYAVKNPSQMENNFLNTITITLKGTTILWKKIFLSEICFEKSIRFLSTIRPTVHANPPRKRSFSKTLFKPEEFENAGFVF